MNYSSPFPTFATPALNQLAAALWTSLLGSFPITDVLGLMMLEQLAFSHWAAQELARKQSRDLAACAEADSPAMLRLSRERRAECRLQAQLARQLNQHIGQLANVFTETSKAANKTLAPERKMSTTANTQEVLLEISTLAGKMSASTPLRLEPQTGNTPRELSSGSLHKEIAA